MNKYINQEFGFSVVECNKLNGYDNTNYLVKTSEAQYIFKTYHYSESLFELVQAESDTLLLLEDHASRKFPEPLATIDGSYVKTRTSNGKQQICRMLSFLDGQFLGDVPHTEVLFQSLGTFLAQLDLKLEGIKNYIIQSRVWEWDLQYFELNRNYINDIAIAKDRNVVLYFFQQFDEVVRPCFPELRKQIIHNDANEWNVLVQDGRISGINEVAIAVTYACYDKENPLEWACILLKAYHEVLPLEEREIELLYYLIAARLCTSVCNSAHAKKVDPSNSYASVSENSAWKMIRRWLAIGPLQAQNQFKKALGMTVVSPPSTSTSISSRHQHISPILSTSYNEPIHMVRSAFQYMFDAHGNSFLDAYNNIPHVGHSHPKVVEAGQRQMAILNTNTRYLYDQLPSYVEKLSAKFPPSLNKVFLVNSGSAASDLAIRMAQFHTGHKLVMVLEEGYHGNTQTSIDISDYKFNNPKGQGQKEFILITALPDTYKGKYSGNETNPGTLYGEDAVSEIKNAKAPIAAFIAEPIVGCAGQIPLADGYLKEVYPAIRAQGGVCISDEVQTGFGRLGDHYWGYEAQGVVPDMVVLGKPIANGHPMGAVVCTDEIAASFEKGVEFFSSFGGNPVSCAIAEAVLEVIEEEQLQENAKATGDYYKSELQRLMHRYPCIGDVRGSGLFIGIEIVEKDSRQPDTELAHHIKNELKNRNILISTDGKFDNIIKTKPPMCFTKEDVRKVVQAIDHILTTYYYTL
jgi:ethanolamine-phosphate phospho-lyase